MGGRRWHPRDSQNTCAGDTPARKGSGRHGMYGRLRVLGLMVGQCHQDLEPTNSRQIISSVAKHQKHHIFSSRNIEPTKISIYLNYLGTLLIFTRGHT
jgi:hypothetical protein